MATNRKKIKPVKVILSTYHRIESSSADIYLSWNKTSRKHNSRRHLGPEFCTIGGLKESITCNLEMSETYRTDPWYREDGVMRTTPEEMIEYLLEENKHDLELVEILKNHPYVFEPNELQKGVSRVFMADKWLTIKGVEKAIKWMLKTHYKLPFVTLHWEDKPIHRKNWEELDKLEWQRMTGEIESLPENNISHDEN